MKKVTVEAKTLEEAYREAEKQLKATKDQISFEIIEENTQMFGKTYKVQASLNVDYPMKGLKYLKSILEALGINAMVEMRKSKNKEVQYVITSEENPILIGKGGKTLEAIQIVVRQIVNGDVDSEEEMYKVSVDCGGYKKQRNKQIEQLAIKMAKEVAKTKIAVELDPMNSYERRVIHAKLADWKEVYTESEGKGKDRHIVIKPKE